MNAEKMISLMGDITNLYESIEDFDVRAKAIGNVQKKLYDMIYIDDIDMAYISMMDFDLLKSELKNPYTIFDLERYQKSLFVLKDLLEKEIKKL